MISCVVLTHNSAGSIDKTLASLSFCDERIVVDDYSTDETTAIARKHGAKVEQRHLDRDFAAQRNFGLSKAGGEWVLFVDSDEVISHELRHEIEEAVKNKNVEAYFLKRRDFLWGRWLDHGETAGVTLIRLAKKDAGNWERAVHEVWKVQGSVGQLQHPLLHYPHPNVAQFLDDINTYSTLNARILFDQGIRVPWWHIPAYPKAKFIVNYFFRLGFLDGMPGALMAWMMSFHSFLTRAKLWVLWDKRDV